MERLIPLFLAFFLFSCTENTPGERLQTNVPYYLSEMPDSLYIASLDSIISAEPLREEGDSSKTEVIINSFKAPAVVAAPKKQPATTKTPAAGSEKPKNTAPHFVSNFSAALSKWQSDPSNKNLYREIEAKPGEDLFKLLARAYQTSTAELPRFYILSAMQSVNPGVMLESLKAGDVVRIPKI
ncbi:MAG: hypothetical protein LBR60_07650 [Fibrobacter sp.]|jgi:hypothetical protein|nr:hypothetical protein [Fibrobacter sp.]